MHRSAFTISPVSATFHFDAAGGDCVVEADAPSRSRDDATILHTRSGHSVIEDGVAVSQFDYEPHSDAEPIGRRSLKSWWASHVRLVQFR